LAVCNSGRVRKRRSITSKAAFVVAWTFFGRSLSPPLKLETFTEVQRVSFVGYTGGEGGSLHLWNLQNLHASVDP